MHNPEIMRVLANDRIETLRRDAARPLRTRPATRRVDTADVVLRLCRVDDDTQLERLAALEGRTVPFGRMVVADVRGHIVAAKPVGGGRALADPFVRTDHLLPLLDLRVAQLREPQPRRWLAPALRLVRARA
ncbi:MAG TPA: hypothetical protein VFA05_02060 [Gaiellaceae bacterium]|nr:hypothetical protein [Gaiellaceae bacterium]